MNGSSVPAGVNAAAATAGGAGLMMLNGATAVNPAASGLLMPHGAAAGGTGLMMQRPVMLPSASSPAAGGYLLTGAAAGVGAPAMLPQYVVGYPQPTGMSPDLAATYAAATASPYGVSVPPAAFYR